MPLAGLAQEPRPGRSELADAAIAANDRRRADARQRLSATLTPDAVAPPAIVAAASAGPVTLLPVDLRFSAAEADDLVDRILEFEDNQPPRFGFSLRGAPDVDDRVEFRATYEILRPDVATVHAKLASGAVLILPAAEAFHPALLDLCLDIEELTGPGASADLVVMGPGGIVEVRPRADADWLLVAVDGELHLAEADAEDRSAIAAGTGATITWMPGHAAVTVRSAGWATALRISLPRLTTATVAPLIHQRSLAHPPLRADLPRDLTAPITSYGGSLFDTAGAFRTAVESLVTPEVLGEAALRFRMAGRPSTHTTAAQALDLIDPARRTGRPPQTIRLAPPGGVLVTGDGPDTALVISGMRLAAEPKVALGLAGLADGRWRPLESGFGALGLGSDEVGVLIHELLLSGSIEVASGSEGGST